MAATPAEYEEMDRDELLEEVEGLDRRLSDMQEFVYGELKPTMERLSETVESLEKENQRLRARLDDSEGGKEGKVTAIVEYANNARNGAPAVKLTYKEIVGATGCSNRYAYDLMDRLPEEYDWFLTPEEMRQYGSIELDNTDERRLGVDFEGVHSSGCPLNKFNNGERSKGGSE